MLPSGSQYLEVEDATAKILWMKKVKCELKGESGKKTSAVRSLLKASREGNLGNSGSERSKNNENNEKYVP